MRIRVLIEQQAHGDHEYIASGAEVDLPAERAKELLNRGDAEPMTVKRNGGTPRETR